MKLLALSSAALIFALSPLVAKADPPPTSTMNLTFNDDFSATTLNYNKWSLQYNFLGAINSEKQFFTMDEVIPFAKPGVVRLRADNRPFLGLPYTAGLISTKNRFWQTYGYFEMRARLPSSRGFWPALCLYGENPLAPAEEIDIMENHTVWPTKSGHNYHFQNFKYNGGKYFDSKVNLGDDYHIYATEWRKGLLVYYVDNKEVFRFTGDSVPTTPMYMLATLTVSSPIFPERAPDKTTVWPSAMDIDYIRAYQFKNSPPPPNVPIKNGPLTLSKHDTAPGDAVYMTASLDIGNANVKGPIRMGIAVGDESGGIHKVITAGLGGYYSDLNANTRFTKDYSFTIPADLPTGYYTIVFRTFDSAGKAVDGTTVAERFYNRNPKLVEAKNVLQPLIAMPAPLPTGNAEPSTSVSTSANEDMSLSKTYVSSYTAKAGQVLTINNDVSAKKDLSKNNISFVIRPNGANSTSTRYLNTIAPMKILKAGTTKTFSAQFTVPNNMPPGQYNIETWVNYERTVFDRQTNVLTIIK